MSDKIQRTKWLLLSKTVQAQLAIIASALVAAIESETTAGWINLGVAVVSAGVAIVGRWVAEGALTTRPGDADDAT